MKFVPLLSSSVLAIGITCLTSPVLFAHEDDKPKMEMGVGHAMSAGPATISVSILPPTAPFQAGTESTTLIRLSDAQGKPVTFEQLAVAHTKKIHLLIIDEGLTDYHHEHPIPANTSGEYSFTFKPSKGGRYVIFADLHPTTTDKQEYAKTEVAVSGSPAAPDMSAGRVATVDGYKFELTTEGDGVLRVGEATLARVKVTKPDGQPADILEPVMGAFAHGVGFPSDLKSVVHVHPMGVEPEKGTERGGPDLSFHIVPMQAGYMKFYVQVQIDGRDRFAGFGFNVEKAADVATDKMSMAEKALTPAKKEFLAKYEDVRTALAADDLAAAKKASSVIPADIEGISEIVQSTSIKEARNGFKKLSANAVTVASKQDGFYVMSCPMTAKGVWVQVTKEVQNPYFGKAMLECGGIQK